MKVTRRSVIGGAMAAIATAAGAKALGLSGKALGLFPELRMATVKAPESSATKPWFMNHGEPLHQEEVTGVEKQAVLSTIHPGFILPSALLNGSPDSATVVRNAMRDGTTIISAGVLVGDDHALAHYAGSNGHVTDILWLIQREPGSAQPSTLSALAISHDGHGTLLAHSGIAELESCVGCACGCCQYCNNVNWNGVLQCCWWCALAGGLSIPCVLGGCFLCYELNCHGWTPYCCNCSPGAPTGSVV